MRLKKNNTNNNITVLLLSILLIMLLSLSFASVPLYKIFCQNTGFGGTPKITSLLPKKTISRKIKINFNTNTNKNLPWKFKPLQKETTLKLGELGLVFFQIKNYSEKPIIGIAS